MPDSSTLSRVISINNLTRMLTRSISLIGYVICAVWSYILQFVKFFGAKIPVSLQAVSVKEDSSRNLYF